MIPTLNILFAPNACGKTTLFEALRRALLDNHKVGGKDIEAIKPWGRDLAPTVQVLFDHQGETFRITKQLKQQQEGLQFHPGRSFGRPGQIWKKAAVPEAAGSAEVLTGERTGPVSLSPGIDNLVQSLEVRLAGLLKEVGAEKTLAEGMARTGLEFEGAGRASGGGEETGRVR